MIGSEDDLLKVCLHNLVSMIPHIDANVSCQCICVGHRMLIMSALSGLTQAIILNISFVFCFIHDVAVSVSDLATTFPHIPMLQLLALRARGISNYIANSNPHSHLYRASFSCLYSLWPSPLPNSELVWPWPRSLYL